MKHAAQRTIAATSARWAMAIERPESIEVRLTSFELLKHRRVTRALHSLVVVGLCWTSAAAICLLGNAGLDLVAGPSFHWREYIVAERAATAKVALCWVGSALLVPGQPHELQQARALLAAIEQERGSAEPRANRDEAREAESRRGLRGQAMRD